jgi:outer membrane immunogenic protein
MPEPGPLRGMGRIMKRLFLAGFALTVMLGGAKAADLKPVPVYQPAVAPIPYFNWTGCYVGVDVGALWAATDWIDQIPSDPAFGTDLGSHVASGAIGGVRGNCSYQVSNWVVSLEGGYGWTNSTASSISALAGGITDEARIKTLASITGRVGYAWDRFLGYVKGGGASLRRSYSLSFPGAAIVTASETRGGWTVGIGGEYAFLDWLTGFVELDYYRFGSGANSFICAGCGLPVPAIAFDVTTNVTVFKIGLNFTMPNDWDPQRLKSRYGS